jgi:hypothetical protein
MIGAQNREPVAILDAAKSGHAAESGRSSRRVRLVKRSPVSMVIGEVEPCPRLLDGVERLVGLAGFTPGRRLDAIMREYQPGRLITSWL